MIGQLAFAKILGLPALAWGGMFGLALIIFVSAIGSLNFKGVRFLNIKWHRALAILAILVALAHGIFGLLALLGY